MLHISYLMCRQIRDAESSFLWDFDSDSGLKSNTDSWTCLIVIVQAYRVNDADRQILKI